MRPRSIPTLPSVATLLFATTAAAAAQEATLAIDAPETVLELSDSLHVTVTGPGDSLQIFLGDTEVTGLVPVDESIDAGTGQTGYTLFLDALDPQPGECLLVRSVGSGTFGPIVAEACCEVVSNVTATVYASHDASEGPVVAEVVWHELDPLDSLVTVWWYGADITPFVPISGPILVDEELVDGELVTRTERYHLDLSALDGYDVPEGSLELVAAGSEVGGGFSYTASRIDPELVAPPPLTDCHKAALKKFLDAIGLQKENGGTSASANADAIRAAADQLKTDLDQCEPRFPGSPQKYTHTDANGDSVDVIIDFSSTGDSSASGSADAVIAVGGSGSPDGGDGTATNTNPGGAAIGIGGNGAGGTSNPGNGGDGKGTSRQPGQAIGLGGDGGKANPPTGAGGNGGRGTGQRRAGGAGSPITSGGFYPGSNGAPGGQGNGTRGGGGWTITGNGGMSGGQRGPFPQ